MEPIQLKSGLSMLVLAFLSFLLFISCREEEDGFAITNDLRVLYVSVNGDRSATGVSELPVTSSVEMVFSHGLDQEAFEEALDISPSLDYTVSYDETSSFVTITPDVRMEYDVDYTISLPQGSYGAKGESTKADFVYEFNTSEFTPPSITLSADQTSFFEGEVVTVTATISQVVFDDVTFDLVFSGSAEGEGVDFSSSVASVTIPAQQTQATFTITAVEGDAIEGNESIVIQLDNIVNATYNPANPFTLSLGDTAPALELKGVMHLRAGTSNGVRAVHLNVLEDIADLSTYGLEINSNGTTTPIDPANLDYFFPAMAVSAGDQILVVRDLDAANATAYFDVCFSEFDHVLQTGAMTHNGDDAILLYNEGVAIETFGELAVDGSGQPWEYTGSWGYKVGSEWIYGTLDCANDVGTGTTQNSSCVYPLCGPALRLMGVSSLLWDGSGTNGGKFVHVQAMRDITDLSSFGIGVANNGGGTDGVEFTFPAESVSEGDHILIAREPATIGGYFGTCNSIFAKVYQSDIMQQNGDDAVELFENEVAIETFGDVTYASGEGASQSWYYANAWAYKVGTTWTYGGEDCAITATSNETSLCSYVLCNQ